MKVIVNKCYGGFGLSPKAVELYAKLSGFKVYGYCEKREDIGVTDFKKRVIVRYQTQANPFIIYWVKDDLGDEITSGKLNGANWLHVSEIKRNDANLVNVVEKLGKDANGSHASLEIVEIPDDVNWNIEEYDGMEWVAETHRTW